MEFDTARPIGSVFRDTRLYSPSNSNYTDVCLSWQGIRGFLAVHPSDRSLIANLNKLAQGRDNPLTSVKRAAKVE